MFKVYRIGVKVVVVVKESMLFIYQFFVSMFGICYFGFEVEQGGILIEWVVVVILKVDDIYLWRSVVEGDYCFIGGGGVQVVVNGQYSGIMLLFCVGVGVFYILAFSCCVVVKILFIFDNREVRIVGCVFIKFDCKWFGAKKLFCLNFCYWGWIFFVVDLMYGVFKVDVIEFVICWVQCQVDNIFGIVVEGFDVVQLVCIIKICYFDLVIEVDYKVFVVVFVWILIVFVKYVCQGGEVIKQFCVFYV